MAIAGKGDDVNTVWYKVDGPGTVDFGDKNVVKTWARNILGVGRKIKERNYSAKSKTGGEVVIRRL